MPTRIIVAILLFAVAAASTGGTDDRVVAEPGPADPRLPEHDEMIGVSIDGVARAYPVSELEEAHGVLRDTVGGRQVVVLWDKSTHAGAVYAPQTEGDHPRQLTLQSEEKNADTPFIDRETGSYWGVEGRAVDGPLKGATLVWQENVQCRWFAWAAEYPKTEVYHSHVGRHTRAVLVEPTDVTVEQAARWKRDGFNAAAVVLDERFAAAGYQKVSAECSRAGLDLYYWIEIARNPAMADAHPQWMASLGVHRDWHARFPQSPLPGAGEVAKAYPWAPITSRPAFDAHLARVADLVHQRAAGNYRGLLLNDLQGGPSSCGCGNLLCRWASDYKVPSTAEQLGGDDVAAKFLAKVKKMVAEGEVIPVWTTECEDVDLPPDRAPGGKSTGLCGSVPCADSTCPKKFAAQWQAMLTASPDAVALLAVSALQRPEAEQNTGWPVRYLDGVLRAQKAAPPPHERLWVVVNESDGAPTSAASFNDLGGVIVSHLKIDQSFQPKVVHGK